MNSFWQPRAPQIRILRFVKNATPSHHHMNITYEATETIANTNVSTTIRWQVTGEVPEPPELDFYSTKHCVLQQNL